jgi:uncharacterized protein
LFLVVYPFPLITRGDFFNINCEILETVIITGGTGLIGRSLTALLISQGYQVIIMSRNPKQFKISSPSVTYALWNIDNQTADDEPFSKAKHIVHLTGAGVIDKPWTNKRKQQIVDSRTKSSALLIKKISGVSNHVESVVSASAIGWYKQNISANAKESDPPDTGFLGETCRLWEESIAGVTALGKRLVILRTGIVLSNDGGAFPDFARPVKYGIAAILGNGKQMISWIHIDDLCRIYLDGLQNTMLSGVYNAVAPNPVSNRFFTLELAKRMKGSFYISIPVPVFALRLHMGGRSEEVLKSSNVSADKIRQTGFQFIYPTIDAAFRSLVPS